LGHRKTTRRCEEEGILHERKQQSLLELLDNCAHISYQQDLPHEHTEQNQKQKWEEKKKKNVSLPSRLLGQPWKQRHDAYSSDTDGKV